MALRMCRAQTIRGMVEHGAEASEPQPEDAGFFGSVGVFVAKRPRKKDSEKVRAIIQREMAAGRSFMRLPRSRQRKNMTHTDES
jgi:hypothetical protein